MTKSLNYNLMRKMTLAVFTALLSIVFTGSLTAQDGEKLFKANCAACHLPTDKALIGPGLAGVQDRWEDKELLYTWIKNPNDAIKTGDTYVTKLVKEWKPKSGVMAPQAVTDEDITAILDYIANPPMSVDVVAPGEDMAVEAESEDAGSMWVWLTVIGFIFLVIALSGKGIKSQLEHAVAEKDGEVYKELSLLDNFKLWASKNVALTAILGLALLMGGLADGYLTLMKVGVFGGPTVEGYHPSQPIAFPHDVHASEDKDGIACQYCHNSVEKSKSAGIPTTNVCMNCHYYIEEGRNTGKTEIAKIYEAINFDPETKKYGSQEPDSVKPIVWNKVHNLPDHVYFNHSQHVNVGEIECENCHGDVTKMKTVQQHAPLTMGWCIDCHGKTEVAGFSDDKNEYYKEYHARMDNETLKKVLDDDVVTVKEIGGWECAKCHY